MQLTLCLLLSMLLLHLLSLARLKHGHMSAPVSSALLGLYSSLGPVCADVSTPAFQQEQKGENTLQSSVLLACLFFAAVSHLSCWPAQHVRLTHAQLAFTLSPIS